VAQAWVSVVGRNQGWIRTDANGVFSVKGLASGVVQLQIYAGGSRPAKTYEATAGDQSVQIQVE
jgi:hypothetical protein